MIGWPDAPPGVRADRHLMKQSDLTPIPIDAATSPSTAWKEVVEPDEHALFEGFAREIEAKQKEVAQQTGDFPARRLSRLGRTRRSFRCDPLGMARTTL